MHQLNSILGCISLLTAEQMMLILVALCLMLVALMGAALLMLHARTRRAEQKVEQLSGNIVGQLAESQEEVRRSCAATRREMHEALASINDSMVRMIEEMTRTQQGQMDALGGQLRAAGHLEEERFKHICVTLEEGIRSMRADNCGQMEMMSQPVDEKLSATVNRRLEASFDAVTRSLEQVTTSLAVMQSLVGRVDAIKDTLSSTQRLGTWGEVSEQRAARMLGDEEQHGAIDEEDAEAKG